MPVPVIVLLAIVGVFVYGVLGAVVATLWLKLWDHLDPAGYGNGTRMERMAGVREERGVWIDFGFLCVTWPALAVTATAGSLGFLLLWGPIWVTRRVATYVAKASVKKLSR
jgi:nitrate reductase NapE component